MGTTLAETVDDRPDGAAKGKASDFTIMSDMAPSTIYGSR